MEDIKLKNIDIDKFKKEIYSYYVDIFPEDERKTLELLNSSYEKQYTKFIEILHKNQIVGFMVLNRIKDKGYAILDYFAILPQYRDNKIGTKSLQALLEQEKESSGIFVEIEKVGLGKDTEDNLLREKRKKFYEKVGFKKLSFDLFLYDVIYTPYLFANIENNEDAIIDEILEIYEAIAGKASVKRNCRIIKELRFEEIKRQHKNSSKNTI